MLDTVEETGLQPFERSMKLLCELGHVELAWDPDNDAKVREMIAARIATKKVTFFVYKPILAGAIQIRRRLQRVTDLKQNRVQIGDEAVEALIQSGDIRLFRQSSQSGALETRISRDPDEIVQSHSIAARAFRGG